MAHNRATQEKMFHCHDDNGFVENSPSQQWTASVTSRSLSIDYRLENKPTGVARNNNLYNNADCLS